MLVQMLKTYSDEAPSRSGDTVSRPNESKEPADKAFSDHVDDTNPEKTAAADEATNTKAAETEPSAERSDVSGEVQDEAPLLPGTDVAFEIAEPDVLVISADASNEVPAAPIEGRRNLPTPLPADVVDIDAETEDAVPTATEDADALFWSNALLSGAQNNVQPQAQAGNAASVAGEQVMQTGFIATTQASSKTSIKTGIASTEEAEDVALPVERSLRNEAPQARSANTLSPQATPSPLAQASTPIIEQPPAKGSDPAEEADLPIAPAAQSVTKSPPPATHATLQLAQNAAASAAPALSARLTETTLIEKELAVEVIWDVQRPGSLSNDLRQLARIDLPQPVARAIAEALHRSPNGVVELTMNPPELGKVRLSIAPVDTGMAISVAAERPETLELLRRNIDTLSLEIAGLGYTGISFTFGGTANDGAPGDRNEKDAPTTIDLEFAEGRGDASAAVETTIRSNTAIAGGVDIRL